MKVSPSMPSEFGPLRAVMDALTEGFSLLAPDFTILELNAEAVAIDGRQRDELIGRSHWEVYPGTEHSAIGQLYRQAMKERKPVAIEHCYDWADGRVSWFETRALPVHDGCLAVLYRDITERRHREQQLAASEQRFKSAVTAVEGILWTNNAHGEMVGEQSGWAEFTGQPFAAYQGYGWSDAIHPADAQPTLDAWQKAVAARSPFGFEHRVRRHDGQWRLCSVRAIPVLGTDGNIIEWVGVHRDVTDARNHALRLQQLGEMTEGVFYVHELAEDRISYVSRAYEHIWGRSREELYADASSFLKVVHPDDQPGLVEARDNRLRDGSRSIEYRLLRDDGEVRFVQDRPVDTIDPISGSRRAIGLVTDVTDFQNTRRQLAQNAETFRGLVEANPFGVYVVAQDFTLSLISRGTRKIFASIDSPVGRNFAEVVRVLWSEPFASDMIARFRHTLETGEAYFATTVEQRADIGEREAYDWRIERIVMPDGQFGVVCYFYDLTERETFERELSKARANEAINARQIDALYAEAPLGLGMLDDDFRFVRLNTALAEMNGFPVAEHIGRSAWDLVPDLRASAEPMLSWVIETGKPARDVIVTGRTAAEPERDRIWREQFYPVFDEHGRVSGIGIIAEDVTQREMEARHREAQEDELRRVLDQLFAFVGTLTPEGIVNYANRTPLEAAGLALNEVVGRPFVDAPWWSHDQSVQTQLQAAIERAAKGEIVRYDAQVQLGQEVVTIDFQIAPLRDREGKITGLIPSGVIIEERVRAEARLRVLTDNLEAEVIRRTAELKTANEHLVEEIKQRELMQAALLQSQKLEAIGQLTAGIAHDFNNILASVLSGIRLAEKWSEGERSRKVLGMSATAAERGVEVIKQLLAFARQPQLSARTIDVSEALVEARGLISFGLPAGIALDVKTADGCWPARADPALLQSALLNLAFNARDAMPTGGTLSIYTENVAGDAGTHGDQVAIILTDTGAGMPPEVLARIAEPFFTTKGAGKGTGLGVSMVHGFAFQSGGSLKFESTVGIGTTAILTLPRAFQEQIEGRAAEPSVMEAAHNVTILVVDDDPELPELAAEILVDAGYKVITAASADAALTVLERTQVDLILSDVTMPGMDGVELAREVERLPEPPKILFMTGHADRRRLQGHIVIDKPFTAATLISVIAQSLGERL